MATGSAGAARDDECEPLGGEDVLADGGAQLLASASGLLRPSSSSSSRPARRGLPAAVRRSLALLAGGLTLGAVCSFAASQGRGRAARAPLRGWLVGLQSKTQFLDAARDVAAEDSAQLPNDEASSPARKANAPPPSWADAPDGEQVLAAAQATSLPPLSVTYSLSQPAPTSVAAKCGLVQEETDYPGNDLRAVLDVPSAEACCQECADDPNCVAWTWGSKRDESFSDGCFLKGGHPRGQLTRVKNPAFTSGQPTQVRQTVPLIQRETGQSLFCFSLMIPYSYEGQLLAAQYKIGESIFGCDGYSVYSNATLLVAPGVYSLDINHDLTCSSGGEFKTALNLDIFLAVWRKVVDDGAFAFHDWTVKVDPDCVFFPARLRATLWVHKEAEEGVYLNNCRMGLHGPLEVLSTNAVKAWSKGSERCVAHFNKLCSGDCLWGEDMFIDQCLWKVLNVTREDEPALLLEDHCDPPNGWKSCQEVSTVAFHPFKALDDYETCVKNARAEASA